MDRRQYLTAVGVGFTTALAGCGGSSNTEPEQEESLEDYVQLRDHEFTQPPVGSGLNMDVTVENVSDSTLGLINVDSNVYIDNERVDDGGVAFGDLPAGTTETDDLSLIETTGDIWSEITNYEIIVSTHPEGVREELQETYEFDEFNYPPE